MKNEFKKSFINVKHQPSALILVLSSFMLAQTPLAAIPARAVPVVGELKTGKATPSMDYESEFARLNSVEAQYAESPEQQLRLRSATQRVASGQKTYQPRKQTASRPTTDQQQNLQKRKK